MIGLRRGDREIDSFLSGFGTDRHAHHLCVDHAPHTFNYPDQQAVGLRQLGGALSKSLEVPNDFEFHRGRRFSGARGVGLAIRFATSVVTIIAHPEILEQTRKPESPVECAQFFEIGSRGRQSVEFDSQDNVFAQGRQLL